jgi:hypothetical protein
VASATAITLTDKDGRDLPAGGLFIATIKLVSYIVQGLDANAFSNGASFYTGRSRYLAWEVQAVSGTHTTHDIFIQGSLDDTNFDNITSANITGLGRKVETINFPYLRPHVQTQEGAASLVNVLFHTKH